MKSTSKFTTLTFGLALSATLLVPAGLAYAAPTTEPTQTSAPATSKPAASAPATSAPATTKPTAGTTSKATSTAATSSTAVPSSSATAPATTPPVADKRAATGATAQPDEEVMTRTAAIAKAASLTNMNFTTLSAAFDEAKDQAQAGVQWGKIVSVTQDGCVLVVTAVTGAPGTYRLELWDDYHSLGYYELVTTGPDTVTYRHLITQPFGTLDPGIDVVLSADGTQVDAQRLWDDPASAAAASALFTACASHGCSGHEAWTNEAWTSKVSKSVANAKNALYSPKLSLPSTGN